MQLTESILRRLIKESIQKVLKEEQEVEEPGLPVIEFTTKRGKWHLKLDEEGKAHIVKVIKKESDGKYVYGTNSEDIVDTMSDDPSKPAGEKFLQYLGKAMSQHKGNEDFKDYLSLVFKDGLPEKSYLDNLEKMGQRL